MLAIVTWIIIINNTLNAFRNMLVLTENYAGLSIIQELLGINCVTIFGNRFPHDHHYTEVSVKVQTEALAESSVVFGRVFGNKVGRRKGRFIHRHSNINGTGLIHKLYVQTSYRKVTRDGSVAPPDATNGRQPEPIGLGI